MSNGDLVIEVGGVLRSHGGEGCAWSIVVQVLGGLICFIVALAERETEKNK